MLAGALGVPLGCGSGDEPGTSSPNAASVYREEWAFYRGECAPGERR